VEELIQLQNIFLAITPRITITTPPDSEPLEVPTLSIDAVRMTFRRIYEHDERLHLTDKTIQELDFHPLSVTLLATVARQHEWDNSQTRNCGI
jgi:hypothetical protein